MIKCNACGQENAEGVKTCVYCGTPMDENTQNNLSENYMSQYSGNIDKFEKLGDDYPNQTLWILSFIFPMLGFVLFFLTKGKPCSKKYLIAGIVPIILSLLFGGFILMSSSDNQNTLPDSSTISQGQNAEDFTDQPFIGTITTEKKNIVIDDIDITITGNEFVAVDKNYDPGNGKAVLKITISYKNIKEEDWWTGTVSCKADGKSCTLNNYSNVVETKPLSSTEIKAGERIEGVYYFDVPTNAQTIQLEFDSIFDATTTAVILKK